MNSYLNKNQRYLIFSSTTLLLLIKPLNSVQWIFRVRQGSSNWLHDNDRKTSLLLSEYNLSL